MMHRLHSLYLACSVAALWAAAAPALAQQAAGAPHAQDNGSTVQEIIVTAQRRAQNLLSVPLSISAATGDQLQRAGIRDLSQLQFTTPGFVPSYSSGYTQFYIRGIGNSIFVGADPSVATFVDDVPRIYGSMVENLVDVERVEVLKGAQGGLYGRNATGGVVNVITHQPSTDSFHGNALVSYGTRNTARASAFVNMPLNDRMAFSLSFDREAHDPYVKNIAQPAPYAAAMFPQGWPVAGLSGAQLAAVLNTGVNPPKGVEDQDFWAFDSKLLIKPTDNFRITFAGDYARKRDTQGNQIVDTTPRYTGGLFMPGFFSSLGIPTNFPPGFVQGSAGKFTDERAIPVLTWLTDYGGSATAVWSLPSVDVTSITAYRAQQTDFLEELAAAPVPLITALVQNRKWYLYQELRAVSTDTGRFHFLGGGAWLSNNFHGESTIDILPPLISQTPTVVTDAVRNWSVYGQLGYDITDALSLTVSGRYVEETNEALFTSPTVSGTSTKESKFLPSATLSYRIGGGNVYARYAEGFKAGGVNPVAPPNVFLLPGGALTPGSVFGPETVKTYEAGYRAPLFDRRVQVTLAGFYNDYRGLQTAAHANAAHAATIIEAIVNAGSARTYGAEGSVTWRVSRAVTLGVNAGYLNARYKQFAITNSDVLEHFDFSGAPMPNSPKWQLSLSGDLDQPLNDRYRLVGSVLISHLSSLYFIQSGLPGVLPDPGEPGYWLTNARIGVRTSDDKYGVAIFANNLFDKGYFTYGSSSSEGNVLTWGAPRIVGAEISAKF